LPPVNAFWSLTIYELLPTPREVATERPSTGGLEVSEERRLKTLKDENWRLD
jgi:hypothetical protein